MGGAGARPPRPGQRPWTEHGTWVTRLLVIMRPVVLLRHKRTQCLRRTHRPRSEARREYQLVVVAMDLRSGGQGPRRRTAFFCSEARHWLPLSSRSLGDQAPSGQCRLFPNSIFPTSCAHTGGRRGGRSSATPPQPAALDRAPPASSVRPLPTLPLTLSLRDSAQFRWLTPLVRRLFPQFDLSHFLSS